jgi:Phosphotransferase enzyme family
MTRAEAAPSLHDLLEAAGSRQPWAPEDTKSGARFERVVIGGERFVLKYQDPRDDWLLRATGDPGVRYVRLWEEGLMDRLPEAVDPAVVAVDFDGTVGMILLRDVTDLLLTPGARFTPDQHSCFLDNMAAMHAALWGWRDDVGLTPLATRYRIFSLEVARAEAARGSDAVVPRVMADGWGRLPDVAPDLAELVLPLLDDPGPLVAALESVPHTLVHGDWKAANLASHPDGRTVLLDFGEVSGEASPLADLTWYLALNADLLPESKDQALLTYRSALEGHGIDTGDWWERAVALELLGTMVQFGWEKALGGPGPELAWWAERAASGVRWL